MLRPRDALRVFHGRATEGTVALHERFVVISVFDYGAGNLQSVQNTLGAIGAQYELIRDAAAVERSHKLILPGVGHFGQMLRALDNMGVRDAIVSRIRVGIPFLGICLGMQALFESSEEAPNERGLGIYPGKVRRFQGDVRIPHMGWNQLQITGPTEEVVQLEPLEDKFKAFGFAVRSCNGNDIDSLLARSS